MQHKSIRLKGFNYASSRWSFVTIVTAGRRCNLSRIEGCEVRLSKFGKVVDEEWQLLPSRRPYTVLGPHAIMPNHFHCLLAIGCTEDAGDPESPERELPTKLPEFGQRPPQSLSTITSGFKSGVANRVNDLRGTPGADFWQRRFHDHVVRNEKEWEEIASYILFNPVNWHVDRDNPEGSPSDEEMRFWKRRMGL
jgi:REP element-mobilizing transposase RayT